MQNYINIGAYSIDLPMRMHKLASFLEGRERGHDAHAGPTLFDAF